MFNFVAYNGTLAMIIGTIEAIDSDHAKAKLRRAGYFPFKIVADGHRPCRTFIGNIWNWLNDGIFIQRVIGE